MSQLQTVTVNVTEQGLSNRSCRLTVARCLKGLISEDSLAFMRTASGSENESVRNVDDSFVAKTSRRLRYLAFPVIYVGDRISKTMVSMRIFDF